LTFLVMCSQDFSNINSACSNSATVPVIYYTVEFFFCFVDVIFLSVRWV